jgi:hypothetical protein
VLVVQLAGGIAGLADVEVLTLSAVIAHVDDWLPPASITLVINEHVFRLLVLLLIAHVLLILFGPLFHRCERCCLLLLALLRIHLIQRLQSHYVFNLAFGGVEQSFNLKLNTGSQQLLVV